MNRILEPTLSRVRADYAEGMSLYRLRLKYHWVGTRALRSAVEGLVRPSHCPTKSDPSEDEVVRRRDEIKASWTPEQARLRWVGRYLARAEGLGSCLSRVIRDMGGDA